MMKKLIIEGDSLSELKVLGISSSERRDYVLASLLNKNLDLGLVKQEDFCFHDGEEMRSFSFYCSTEESPYLRIALLAAKDKITPLLKKAAQMDFFLLYEKRMPNYMLNDLMDKTKKIPQILYFNKMPKEIEHAFQEILVDLEMHIININKK
jgi:hypothetical protein